MPSFHVNSYRKTGVFHLELRTYQQKDCPALAKIFYETVHAVNVKDYTPAQLNAWAPGTVDFKKWNERFINSRTLVAVDGSMVIGYGNIDKTGYLDHLYVHKDYQRKGVATLLCDALEACVKGQAVTVHASITAKPFFEKRGYRVIKQQEVKRQNVLLTNFLMSKII